MKSTIKELPPPAPAFTPFEITIRVDSEREAKALGYIADNTRSALGVNGTLPITDVVEPRIRGLGLERDFVAKALAQALSPMVFRNDRY